MTIHDVSIGALLGGPADLAQYRGKTMLIVNVASKCGLTPQYESLQRLYERYRDRGLVVIGVPCNQFGGQEPGTALQIADFCGLTYGVTFPVTEKVEVIGDGRHPLYDLLVTVPDADGTAGEVRWNFEKFLVAPEGSVVARFRPLTQPESPEIIEMLEKHLTPAPAAPIDRLPLWRRWSASRP
jgi:glutathione peroxidase